jgi:hypothetical protein
MTTMTTMTNRTTWKRGAVKKAFAPVAAMALLAAGCAAPGGELDRGGIDAGAAFARMKTLVGTYETPATEVATSPEVGGGVKVSYEVTSGGHTLMEKLDAGGEHEMVSLYFLEGFDLALVHYCAIGNRPHMRLDRAASTIDDLRFEWDGTATDIDPAQDPHIHTARFRFKDATHAESEWTFWKEGKADHTKTFALDRATAAAGAAVPGTAPPVAPAVPGTEPPAAAAPAPVK